MFSQYGWLRVSLVTTRTHNRCVNGMQLVREALERHDGMLVADWLEVDESKLDDVRLATILTSIRQRARGDTYCVLHMHGIYMYNPFCTIKLYI